MLNQSGGETDEHRQLRRAAFLAIVVSTVAVIASIVTLPLLYSYVANFQSHLLIETDFCKARSRDMWSEMSHLHKQGLHRRQKRQYGVPASSGYGSPFVNAEPEGCCSCQQGPPGPPGLPGDDGLPGKDAAPGNDAGHGKDGQVLRSAIASTPCLICPPGVPGQQGPRGKTGPQGPKGKPGNAGTDGKRGEDGLQASQNNGPIGVGGNFGPPGGKGPRGAPGRVNDVNGPLGPAGAPGPQGAPGVKGERGQPGNSGSVGQQGLPGDIGRPGQVGNPGSVGSQGLQGPNGESGGCDHCPPPRTPPGY